MIGAERHDAALARTERQRAIPERHTEGATPHHHRFGRVVVPVPPPEAATFDAHQTDVQAAEHGVVLPFAPDRQSLEDGGEIQHAVHRRS